MEEANSKFVRWPVPPKVKETHFKVVHTVHPVAEFLKRRLKCEADPCSFCHVSEESLEHLFFFCPVSKRFWSDVKDLLSLKLDDIPNFNVWPILFYMDNLNVVISDMIDVVILMGTCHCCKWRDSGPSFMSFMNEFKMFFMALKKLYTCKLAKKINADFSHFLLF